MEAVEKWREQLAVDAGAEVVVGAGLVGFGVMAAAFALLGGRRGLLAWALPGALVAAGVVMLSDSALDVRRERIAEAQADIEERLETLDPIARAMVLKNVGQRQLQAVIPHRR